MTVMFIQTLRWMMQAKVWRFMGFASAIVGLVCYALSSSFNHLFGNWNLFKIILYTVFSFIICLLILYAKTWDQSTSARFEAQLAFLVLTITSVYSFFSDKVMNGKPDAYSLISCAAFAVMSLSLSRQTKCGFQVDLLYFFLGCLIVQLMKIKLQLVIVGAGFSYSFIVLRSFLSSIDARAGQENEYPHEGLQDENSVVLVVDSSDNSNTVVSSLMEQLRNHVKALQQDNSNLNDMVLEQAREYFEDDSETVLSNRSFEGMVMIDSLSPERIQDLQDTAKLMMSVGFEKECSEVYSSCRRECLEEFMMIKLLGFQKASISIEDVHKMTWNDLNKQIRAWVRASKIALRTLFPTERRLSDLVFLGFSTAAELAFTEVCRGCTLQLLNFADGVATGGHSLERLFKMLDVFETLHDLTPEIEALFCDQYSVSLRNKAITVLKRLEEAIRGIFMELENSIRLDRVKTEIPGGGLHPITRYVMNYLRGACDYQQALEQVFQDYGHLLPKLDDRVPSSSPLSLQMRRIMELLESNLEARSKIYKDPALCNVFLMNNTKYIVQKIKDTELGALLGNDVIQKHTEKVRQHREHYQQNSWDKVLGILKLDGNGSAPPNEIEKSVNEKLKSFIMLFEEICTVQSSWFIFDWQLRIEITNSLEKMLLPAYRRFIAGFEIVPELAMHADKYIKYGTELIETRLDDLFQKRSGSTGSRSRS